MVKEIAFEVVWAFVLKRGEDTVVGRILTMEVTGTRGRGRLARRWKDVVDYYMRVIGFEKVVAMDREAGSTPCYRGKRLG